MNKTTFAIIIFNIFIFPAVLSASLSGRKVCLDPGHGGSDPGAVNGDTAEADMVLDVSLRTRPKLQNHGASVLMTRDADTTISLQNRVSIANNNNADIFISPHLNSFHDSSAHGTETYAYSSGGNGEKLASKVQTRLLEHLERYNRGVKYAGYYVIRYTSMPAALSEGLFLSNPTEKAVIVQSSNREAHAVAVYEAVCDYYGVMPEDGGGSVEGKGGIKGFVYDEMEGGPGDPDIRIAGAECTLSKGSSEFKDTTSSTGLFTFSDLEPGEYTLTIKKEGFVTKTREDVSVTADVDGWYSTGLVKSASAGNAYLRGFVFNLSSGLGNVQENRISDAECVLKNLTTNEEQTILSDENGLFRFNDLDTEYTYSLTINKDGFVSETVGSISLNEGDNWASTGIEEIDASALGHLEGTVTSSKTYSVIVNAVCILTNDESGDPFTVYTENNGTYFFEDMVPGDYTLEVNADGYAAKEVSVSIISDDIVTKDVQLNEEDAGDTGDSGNTGDSGDTGDTGNTGNTGNTGDTGNTGNTGDSADTGDTANSGDSGDTADTGNSGNSGNTGEEEFDEEDENPKVEDESGCSLTVI